MKYSAAYLLAFALGTQASMCDLRGPKEVGPGWFVECTKGFYRLSQEGTEYKVDGIGERACAEKCMQKGYQACNYHADNKRCVFGRKVGNDLRSPGYVLIKRVQEDGSPYPSGDDQKSCEEEKAACLELQRSCENELVKVKSELAEVKSELVEVKSALAEFEKEIWDL